MHCLFAPHCGRPRLRRGRYCRHHARRLNQYGSVTGRPIPKASLLHFATKAARVLQANSDHDGVRLATRELSTLLDEAHASVRAGEPVDRQTKEYSRLASYAVTPLHILAMVTAVGLFDSDDPRWLRDGKAYRFAVARAVINLAPRKGEDVGSRALAAIGDYLVDNYSPLAASIVLAIKQGEENERRRRDAMATPMTPNTP